MTERERLLKVLKGETPDRVLWFADLGHWYRAESGLQCNLFNIKTVQKRSLTCTGRPRRDGILSWVACMRSIMTMGWFGKRNLSVIMQLKGS